ncbi:MAG: hypothetical protein U0531_02045 [Dehalococcoidia bacterium]
MGGIPTQEILAYAAITVAALALVAVWLGFLVWAWRDGQLRDNEQVKYRVFQDKLPARPPRRQP